MKDGRGRILISRSFRNKELQKNTVEKILNYLSNFSKIYGGDATDKEAEKLMPIIDDPKNTEADILFILEKMEKSLKASETEAK